MRRLGLVFLSFALAATAYAGVVEAPVRLAEFGGSASAAAPAFAPLALTAPSLSSPALSFSPLAAASAFVPAPAARIVAAPGPAAPALPGLEAATRALFQRYLPRLYRPLPVRYVYEESKLGAGGGHSFDPKTGHEISMTPGEPDAQGDVASAIGKRGATFVQPKIEQLATSVHEYAHAVFDDAVGRDVADRPGETAYDAMTEGFAVKVEQLVLEGMARDAAELGLSTRDVADIAKILDARRRWLKTEDTHYAEGTPVWGMLHAEGGEESMAVFLETLKARRLMEVMRVDPVYQLSLGRPETAGAYLGDAVETPLRSGLDAAHAAAAGRRLSPAENASAARAVGAAGPAGHDWLIRRALARESNFGAANEPMWIVPVFLRRAEDLSPALFRLAALNRPLAERVVNFLHQAAARPDGMARLFEEAKPTPRTLSIIAAAEKLPWTAEAKRAWDAAVLRWITAP